MFNFISQIQLANLSGLLLAAAAPFLILAYMRTRSKKPVLVSSTLILNTLKKRPVARSSIKLPLRFFFELLALLLLCFAATLPSIKGEGRIAIVLDNSLSMGTRIDENSTTSRFEKAKEKALERISQLSSGSAVSVYTSSPTLKLQGQRHLSASQAKREVSGIELVLADDSLNSSLNELVDGALFDQVIVLSDRHPLALKETEGKVDSPKQRITKIDFEQIGVPVSNYFIKSVSFRNEGVLSNKESILVKASFSGVGQPRTTVNLFTVPLNNPDEESLKQLISTQEVGFTSQDQEVLFQVPKRATSPLYRIELGDPSTLSKNGNPLDDIAWISQEAVSETRVLLVSPFLDSPSQGAAPHLGLSRIPSMRVNQISPEEYGSLDRDELARYSLIIFHQAAPTQAPEQPMLLVLPPSGNSLFPITEEIDSPRVTSWTSEHPITTYLRVQLLSPGRSAVLDLPSWATSIINSEYGPLIAAGERGGVRVAASGMELLPFEGAATPSASVLTLNLLNWLRKGAQLKATTLTGSLSNVSGVDSWIVIEPGGKVNKIQVAQGKATQSYRYPTPGPYLISTQSKSTGPKSELVIVNSFFTEESSTLIRHPINRPQVQEKREVLSDSGSSLWKYFIYIGLTFLLVEFMLRYRKVEEAVA
jgi:hypothetical protein